MSPEKKYNELLGSKLIKSLEKRRIEGYYCETKEEALQKALELIPDGSKVAWGGSRTLNEVGLLAAVRSGDYEVIDRDKAVDVQAKRKCEIDAFSSDVYCMSTNAISLDGTLVNIDGSGNRVSALIFGPKNVLIIAGVNKITQDEQAAIARAKQVASPLNSIRLERQTPCVQTGVCAHCLSDGCICRHTVITRMSNGDQRIKVIIVGEPLGF